MSMMGFINRQLEKAEEEGFCNYDPGDYAQCESCDALNMRDCLDCPIASYNTDNATFKAAHNQMGNIWDNEQKIIKN